MKKTNNLNELEAKEILKAGNGDKEKLFNTTINFAGLWIRKTKTDDFCLIGNSGKNLRIFMFKVKERKTEKTPNYTLNIGGNEIGQKLINVGGVYCVRDELTGELYFDGWFANVSAIVRKNQNRFNDEQPHYILYLGEAEERETKEISFEDFENRA